MYKNIKIIRPLEQVRLLVFNAIRSIKSVNVSFVSFFIETMTLVLTIKGRINFLQLARYGKSCESRFRQNFRKPFEWLAFNMGLIKQQAGHLYAIAIDPSYISKSGKHTPGIGYFWSGCAGAAKRGLEALGIALIDATTREAFALRVVQTIKGVVSKGRPPKCVEHIEKDSLIRHYLLTLHKYSDRLLTLSNILVADAYFAKSTFVDGVLQLRFQFISRLRDDVRMRYLYTGKQKNRKGRRKQYGDKVDINNLDLNVFRREELLWNEKTVITYSAVVNVISLERNVKVVIVDCLDDDKKTQVRKVFFSTDCTMATQDIINIYSTRFQIEFLFRDSKQFMGLQHCQSRNVNAIDFHLNLSLAAVNVARAFCKQCGIDYSIGKVKLLLHNAMMIERFISTFGKMTEHTKNKPPVFDDKNKLFKDLLFLGINDAA